MRTKLVVPAAETVKSPLKAAKGQRQKGNTPPLLERSEESFDFSVGGGASNAALHVTDARLLDASPKRASKLCTVIGNDVLRLSVFRDRAAHQADHLSRVGRAAIEFNRQELSAESVENRRHT